MDVSSAGACLRIDHVPPKGPQLWLVVENVPPIPVAVAWEKKNRLGLRFLEEQSWVLETCEPRLELPTRADDEPARLQA
jgi:hypothetical protein